MHAHAGGRFKDPKVAVKFLNEVHEELGDRIILVTQPCPHEDVSAMKYVSDNSKIPIFAHGYGIKTIKDIEEIIDVGAAKGIWVHTYRMGGFYLCTKIIHLVKKNNLGLYMGNGGADGITITAGAHLVAGTEDVLVADVADDLKYPWLRIVSEESMPVLEDGARIPSDRPGLGIELKDWVKMLLEETIKIGREG